MPRWCCTGAGCGLISATLLSKGYRVVATDKASVLDLLQTNTDNWLRASNDASRDRVRLVELDWATVGSTGDGMENTLNAMAALGGGLDAAGAGRPCPDLVVCSDCLYSSAAIAPLLNVLEAVSRW